MITIGKRLELVANMLGSGEVLIDIGCDHAYLPIYLLAHNKIKRAIAVDISKGPLKSARVNLEHYNLADKIELRLSDGLDRIGLGEADLLSICGMGGRLIYEILKASKEKLSYFRKIVIEPQSEINELLEKISDLGLGVSEEGFVKDRGKFYPVFVLSSTQLPKQHRFGDLLGENEDFIAYLDYRKTRLEKVIKKIKESGNSIPFEIQNELKWIVKRQLKER